MCGSENLLNVDFVETRNFSLKANKENFVVENTFERDPKSQPELQWWQTEVVYQIYPRSFYDAEPPFGTGDLAGITQKVEYFKDLGVGVIWLSPIFESPMADFGYDVSNFTNIDPIFGDLNDFRKLIQTYHDNGIRIVMDFIPNHSSDEHIWFELSKNKTSPFSDFYVWQPSKGIDEHGNQIPPNNWLSVFGGSAWEWSQERGEFYLHQFLSKQPDLNFRNPLVVQKMNEVVEFWLDLGVDGFRVDAIKHLFEVEDMSQDESISDQVGVASDEYGFLNHTLTVAQPEVFDVLVGWRKILDKYSNKVMMTETYESIEDTMKHYGNSSHPIADFPFNFFFITSFPQRSSVSGNNLKDVVDLWMDHLPPTKWPNWVLGNHDNGRIASRLGADLVDALHMVTMLLPGTPVTYYGEELGMTDIELSYSESKDPFGCFFGSEKYEKFSRDPERSPMQWNKSSMAGFTSHNSSWLPINTNHDTVNVESQLAANQSHLKLYKDLVRLRKTRLFQNGGLSYPLVDGNIFSFVRHLVGHDSYLVVVNSSKASQTVNMQRKANFKLPNSGVVVLRSSQDLRHKTEIGKEIDLTNLNLDSGEGLVIKIVGSIL